MPVEAPVTTANLPLLSAMCDLLSGGLRQVGLQDDLGHLVLLVLEDVVAVRRILERQAVADQEGGVDLALA